MSLSVKIVIILTTIVSMEGVAWFSHKYIMHGFLWILHKDHHLKKNKNWFEENDLFFIIFALPSITLFYISRGDLLEDYRFWIACGISIYGMMYFVIHDVFIHQRFKVFSNAENSYLKAIRRAHKIHHKNTSRKNCECFGMLYVPMKYFRQFRKQKH